MAASMNSVECQNIFPSPSLLKQFLINNVDAPTVFKKQAETWMSIPWTSTDWVKKYGKTLLDFRIVPRTHKGISWEGQAQFVESTISHFISWQTEETVLSDETNPFSNFNKNEYWAYSSYNYMNLIFPGDSDILKDTNWSAFGFPEVTGNESTFWLGSEGAYTPCHFDSYGCNLVAQILGRKKWVLFPPSDTKFMYPTRIPYEESSVFSSVNVLKPDLCKHPHFKKSHPHVVVLEPGDVLFVPKKWWHFVLSLDSVTTSINAWMKLDSDCDCRLEEGVTRALMSSLISYYEPEGKNWLNPKEELVAPDENLQYVISSICELSRSKSEKHMPDKSFSSTKVCKTSMETDVHSHPSQDVGDIFKYESIQKVKSITFGEWTAEKNQTSISAFPFAPEITLKKMIDCFAHPEVISLMCRLLKET